MPRGMCVAHLTLVARACLPVRRKNVRSLQWERLAAGGERFLDFWAREDIVATPLLQRMNRGLTMPTLGGDVSDLTVRGCRQHRGVASPDIVADIFRRAILSH